MSLTMKEDPIKAQAFDEAHKKAARWGPNKPGAHELQDYSTRKKGTYVIAPVFI